MPSGPIFPERNQGEHEPRWMHHDLDAVDIQRPPLLRTLLCQLDKPYHRGRVLRLHRYFASSVNCLHELRVEFFVGGKLNGWVRCGGQVACIDGG